MAGCRAGTPAVQDAAREAACARSILKQAGLVRVRLEGEAPSWGLRFSFPGFDLVAAPAEEGWSVRAEVPICTRGRAAA